MRRSLPKFSLVISTIHRTIELERFLIHLSDQTYKNFELIIVDQNDDDRVSKIINLYKDKFMVIHISSPPGVSRGRNTGIKKISGELVAFPDDDCWYEKDLLEKVVVLFTEHPDIDVISGRTVRPDGQNSLGKFDKHSGPINRRNVFKRGNTNTYFFRREVVEQIAFDESLGPGSGLKWGSAEDADYLLQALATGFKLCYISDLTVYHEEPVMEYNAITIQRSYRYSLGLGRVLKKHSYSFVFVWLRLFSQIGGMIAALLQMDKQRYKYHRKVFKGRFDGWRAPYP
jgi:glycosyltransferase involved in cell wall biosynthesis